MKKSLKKVTSLLLISILSFGISVSSFAAKTKGSSSEYYQEVGQINLDNLNLSVDKNSGNLIIKSRPELIRSSTEKEKLEKQLIDNNELKDSLKSIIKDGKALTAIGYTTVYLKEVTSKDGTHLEPMTVAEVKSAGGKTSKGLLTLYTSAYVTIKGSSRYVDAYSVAHWGNGIGAGNTAPAAGDDFITLSLPPQYSLTSSRLSGTISSYKHDEDYSSVVYGFAEWDPNEISADPVLAASGNSSSAPSNKKFVSRYVHTWADVTPSFTISKDGVSISLGSASGQSWQIASSVSVNS